MSDFRDQDYRRKGARAPKSIAADEQRSTKARRLISALNHIDARYSGEDRDAMRRVVLAGEGQ